MDPFSSTKLLKQRERYRTQIATALEEDPDPLNVYDGFVKWTIENYPKEHLVQSGLLELLEEAIRQFKDDDAYKGDLRYLKLWLLYASHVEDPTVIYAYILANGIGTVYAQTYWEYANALEQKGSRADAESIYKQGIQRRARPVDPLKRRYEEFKGRAGGPAPRSNTSVMLWKAASSNVQVLRRNPLKNFFTNPLPPNASMPPPPPPLPTAQGSSSSFTASQKHDRYAPMLAPPVPGKRPEKLRFNLSLLWTEDGMEYSMQEARARSMGLLGKKWGPPPPSETTSVRFEESGPGRATRTLSRKGFGGAEPTVTLMTKEALADVFGMYNSPERSMRYGAVAGSKHAPVRKIEQVTPMPSLQSHLRAFSNENAMSAVPRNYENALLPGKTPTFQPFVDENAMQKENSMPAPQPKFKPFVDAEQPSKLPTVTPNPGRRALSVKESATSVPTLRQDENAPMFKPSPERSKPPVFSSVFTPAPASKGRPQARPDGFTEEQRSAGTPPSENANVFRDSDAPVKVFSRPPTRNDNTPAASQGGALRPYVDEENTPPPAPVPTRSALVEHIPLRAFAPPPVDEPEDDPEPDSEPASTTDGWYQGEPYDDGYVTQGTDFDDLSSAFQGEEDSMYDEQETGYSAPLGGRFGQFNVMTPITERTFEFTTSTRGLDTPNEMRAGIAVHRDPVETAEMLAAELREDEGEFEGESEASADAGLGSSIASVEERTKGLSLVDALAATSSFKPSNPCNPFDPPIVSTLLSLIAGDHDFYDLGQQESGLLDALQKFARKKSRRTSGNTTSSRLTEDMETLPIDVHDRKLAVINKLGEGGFGAVFEAIDLDMVACYGEEDDDDEVREKCKLALKVVKPRNLWEFHVLRRIHRTLPVQLRQSIISPQALYAFRDESFLALELCKQGTLLDIVNRAGQAGITQQGACLDELLVMFFAIELMRLLEGLHRAGFIHGDVKIDNCLLRLEDVPGPASAWSSIYDPSGEGGWSYKGIKMIDFGRTVDTGLFPVDQQFIAEWPTDARDCLEIREGRLWTYQTDYFGLAGIIYCMLYGKYIEASSIAPAAPKSDGKQRYKLATSMKRYWQVDLWTRLFDLLLNSALVRPDGQLPVCDEFAALREEMEAWLQGNCNRASNTLKGLLKKIGVSILGGR